MIKTEFLVNEPQEKIIVEFNDNVVTVRKYVIETGIWSHQKLQFEV